jgi:hypothetical protein
MESLWTWLSTTPGKNEVLDLFGTLCVLLFAPGFVLSAYLTGPGADRWAKDPIQFAGIRYWATIELWVFGAGLFFIGVRVLQINPLSFGAPIWLIVSILAVVFAATRCVDWWLTVYPAERGRHFTVEAIHPIAELGSRVSNPASRQTIPDSTVRR